MKTKHEHRHNTPYRTGTRTQGRRKHSTHTGNREARSARRITAANLFWTARHAPPIVGETGGWNRAEIAVRREFAAKTRNLGHGSRTIPAIEAWNLWWDVP